MQDLLPGSMHTIMKETGSVLVFMDFWLEDIDNNS